MPGGRRHTLSPKLLIKMIPVISNRVDLKKEHPQFERQLREESLTYRVLYFLL